MSSAMTITISSAHSPTFRLFTYVTTHSPTLPSLYLRHSSFTNPSVASPTSQFILQPFIRFSYVTSSSLNSPGEPPMHSSGQFHMKLHFFSQGRLKPGVSTRGPRAACGPRASFVRPGKGISQNKMRYEY